MTQAGNAMSIPTNTTSSNAFKEILEDRVAPKGSIAREGTDAHTFKCERSDSHKLLQMLTAWFGSKTHGPIIAL